MINSIFDVIKNLTGIKNSDDLGSEHFSAFMVSRFLSMEAGYIHFASYLNRNPHIPDRYKEKFLFFLVPQKRVFFKYIKKDSNLKDISNKIKEVGENLNLSDSKSEELIRFYQNLEEAKNGF